MCLQQYICKVSCVMPQDDIWSANRLTIANNIVNETYVIHVHNKNINLLFWKKVIVIFLREHTLFYFSKAFIIANFMHIKCTSKNSFGILAVCITQNR
jgi:hypothetical protein